MCQFFTIDIVSRSSEKKKNPSGEAGEVVSFRHRDDVCRHYLVTRASPVRAGQALLAAVLPESMLLMPSPSGMADLLISPAVCGLMMLAGVKKLSTIA